MGRIVFRTIAENIRSFFAKEDELLAQPKHVPQAASEVYEHPSAPERIVERPLPKESMQQAKLPFTPSELRAALRAKESERPPVPQKREAELERDISHEISVFESALQDVHGTVPGQPMPPQAVSRSVSSGATPTPSLPAGHDAFFDEFGQFLLRADLDAEGLLEQDIVHRLREFHRSKQEGKEYYVYSTDVQTAVQRKLGELKTLEHEWFHTQQQIDELERGMHGIEQEIEARGRDLKGLLQQAKGRSRLEQRVPDGMEFVLRDGRKLACLLDLKIALRTMPDDVFHHHVTAQRSDFADWARGAIGDEQLASQLDQLRDRHQIDMFLSRLAG